VRWLLTLGIRRGELLGVRVSDLNFQTNEVLIARRADDPEDPRANEPNTKTRDRLLSLEEDLAVLTRRYVTGARRRIEGARRHDYVFVANGTGAPLSLSGLNKIFVVLRTKCPSLPDELSPHVFRHTWNDEFSAVMDKRQVSEETEKKIRARLMGWSETSGTAATYTRRHTDRKAKEASLALQAKFKARSR
jgi:integrase